MFDLLTKAILALLLLGTAIYVVTKFIPRILLTWLGGLVVAALLALAFLEPATEIVSELIRIISLPLTPLGLVIILLSLFIVKGAGKMLWIPLVLLWILSTPIVADQLAQVVEQRAVRIANAKVCCQADETAKAIVLLGRGTTRPNLRPTPPDEFRVQLSDTGELIYYAANLYKQRQENISDLVMIVSAGPYSKLKKDDDDKEAHIEAHQIQKVLERLRVGNIELEPEGKTIRDSADNVKKILEEKDLGKNIVLVTSALNIERAIKTFKKVDGDINVVPRPTDFYTFIPYNDKAGNEQKQRVRDDPEERLPDLFPDARALSVTTRIIQELLLTIYYFLRDWISLSSY